MCFWSYSVERVKGFWLLAYENEAREKFAGKSIKISEHAIYDPTSIVSLALLLNQRPLMREHFFFQIIRFIIVFLLFISKRGKTFRMPM